MGMKWQGLFFLLLQLYAMWWLAVRFWSAPLQQALSTEEDRKQRPGFNHLYTLPDSWLDNVTREEGVILIKALN